MKGEQLYKQLKLGEINKSQLTNNELGEVYKYMIDSKKVSASEIKPAVAERFNLNTVSATPKRTEPFKVSDYARVETSKTTQPISQPQPIEKPSLLSKLGFNSSPSINLYPTRDMRYQPQPMQPMQQQSANPENELADLLTNLSTGNTGRNPQGTTVKYNENPVTWEETPLKAAAANIVQGFNTLGRAGGNIVDMTLGDANIPIVDKYLEDMRIAKNTSDAKIANINKGTIQNFAGQVFQGVGQAIPSVATALFTAPYSAANATGNLLTQGGTQLVNNVAMVKNPTMLFKAQQQITDMFKNPQLATSMIQSVGMQYEQALNAGATKEQAINSAITGGVPSGLIEVLGGTESLSKMLTSKMPIGRAMLESGLGEALEEIIQYPIENLGQKIAFDKDMPLYSTEEQAIINPKQQLEAGAVAFTSSALMGGAGSFINSSLDKLNNNFNKKIETLPPQKKEQALTIKKVIDESLPQIYEAALLEEDTKPVTDLFNQLETQYPELSEYLEGHLTNVNTLKVEYISNAKQNSNISEPTTQPTANENIKVEQIVNDDINIAETTLKDVNEDIKEIDIQPIDNVFDLQTLNENNKMVTQPIDEEAIEVQPIEEIEMPTADDYFLDEEVKEDVQEEVQEEYPNGTIIKAKNGETYTVTSMNEDTYVVTNERTKQENEYSLGGLKRLGTVQGNALKNNGEQPIIEDVVNESDNQRLTYTEGIESNTETIKPLTENKTNTSEQTLNEDINVALRKNNDVQEENNTSQQEEINVPSQFLGETPINPLANEDGYIKLGNEQPEPINKKFTYDNEELETQHKNNRITKASKLEKIKELASEFKKAATRTFRDIDPKLSENAEILKELIRYPKLKSISGDETTRVLLDIIERENEGLSAEEYNRFERFVFLADLMEEIESGRTLPGLWTEESVKRNYNNLKASLNENIQKAVDRRKAYWDNIIKDYLSAMESIGFDVKDRFDKKNYFRHQVLEYVNAKNLAGAGSKVKVKQRGYTKQRKGTEKAINEDYIQAEYEVLATMLYDKEVALMLKRIDKNYGIKGQLKAQAKEENKAIKERNEILAEGDPKEERVTWKDLIPEGYTTWQPIAGKHLFTANTISEKFAEALITDTLDQLSTSDKKVKEMLVMGLDKEQFVLPVNIADTLDRVYNNQQQDKLLQQILSTPLNIWKSWVLTVNPRQVVKYNLRNITGDIDGLMAAAGFKAFNPKLVGRASKELFNSMRFGRFTKDLLEFRDKGGFQDLMYAQELGELNEMKQFKIYNKNDTDNIIRKAIKKMPGLNLYTDFTENLTNYRESIFRYSAYLYFKEDIKKNGKPTYYGASNRNRIDGLKTIEDKAYQLSKDALGSYDEITEVGQAIKKYLIPFYSWNEVNMKRYKRVFENTIKDIKAQEEVGKKVMSGLQLTGYTGLNATRLIGKMTIRVLFASALLMAWNRFMFPDDDDELPDDVKNTPHLTLGRDEKGNIIYFSRLGALNDVFDWFGLDQIYTDVQDIMKERKTVKEQAEDMAIAPLNKLLNSISPFIKTPVEILSGSSYYPDFRNPSAIRDKSYYIANSLGLGEEYRRIAGLPVETSYAETWQKALIYKSNPEVNAYYKAIDLKYQFEEKVLKQQSGRMLGGSEKSEALYYYKMALKYDDKKAADKYLKLYYKLGGTDKGLKQSLGSLNPMYGLVEKRGEREQFEKWLTEEERQILDIAMKYFENLIEQK
jgi:hypothetical protein